MNISSIFCQPESQIALIARDATLTYGELYRKSENLAKHILSYGAKRVVVYGHKESGMMVAYLACLRAGAAYIPVSPTLPVPRRKAIAAQSEAGLVLCTVGRGFAGAGETPTANINTLSKAAPKEEIALPTEFDEDSLAYVIYTSGSTGEPKGVMAKRRNLNNFIHWLDQIIPLRADQEGTILNTSMLSIDLSMVDIYYALSHGRTLVMTDIEKQHHLSDLYPHIQNSNAAMIVMTPTMAEFLMQSGKFKREMLPNLRIVYLSGESLHPGTVRRLLERFGDELKVFNAYGPTEATCNVCASQITNDMCDDRLPVGAIDTAATEIVIMNGDTVLPDTQEGEIVLLGDSVTAGYGRGESGGYCEIDGKPAYRTSDIGFNDGQGRLFWSYRKNSMIKVNGYRIEPGDVENHMTRIKGVTGCGVVERYGHLVAYVTLNRDMTPGQVRAAARPHLPSYMIPGIVRIVDALPMTENGKLDRDRLE